ncbi:MAG: carboxypeptidase-like regulatory domain-containing protein [Terriglobia bacterium]
MILALTLAPCYGQIVNASLNGTVTDISGAIVPEAIVTAMEVNTGVGTQATTDSNGAYLFPSLKPASYSLRVEKTGFKATVISGITLQVAQTANVDAVLQVGAVATTVQVKGAAPMVSTTSASTSTVIGEAQLADMPLDLRRFTALALMTPGVVSNSAPGLSTSSQSSSPVWSTFSETTFSANGTRPGSNMLILDGMMSRNLAGGGFGLQPPPEAIQEFNVQTNVYSAVFGETAGSALNVVTKSGTNRFHGDVWDFLRNEKLDARNFFSINQTNPVTGQEIPGTARPEYRRNQFGFDIGGPIRKNKTFFFGSYEGLRQIQGGANGGLVPTPAQRNGDFSSAITGQTINLCGLGGPANLDFDSGQLFIPATESLYTCPAGSAQGGSTVLVGTPVPGNIITTIDPVAWKVLSDFPDPNRPGYPNFINTTPYTRNDNQMDVRIDQVIGSKDQLFGHYILGNTYMTFLYNSILPGFGDGLHFRGQNAVLEWSHTFGPSLLNEARLGWQRNFDFYNCQGCPRASGTIAGFGINDLHAITPNNEQDPLFGFINFATWGDGYYQPGAASDATEMLEDNLTWIRGRHTVTLGANLTDWGSPLMEGPFSPSGNFFFGGQYSSLATEVPDVGGISDLADFELGAPTFAVHTAYFQNGELRNGKLWNAYVQDDIRVSRSFTLNLGLRWEWHAPPEDRHGNMATFYPLGAPFSGPGNGILISALPDALNDAVCSQNPSLISASGQCLVASSSLRAKLGFTGRKRESVNLESPKVWLPRLGFTWRPLSSDRVVLHAGGGLFGDVPLMNMFLESGTNSPVTALDPTVQNTFASPLPLVNGVPMTTETVFGLASVPNISASTTLLSAAPFFKMPMVGEWSIGIESQLASNWGLSGYYIGNKSWHLDNLHYYFNQPRPGVGDYQSRRPYPDFNGFVFYDTTDSNANYNALQMKLTKRLSSGLMFLVSYTYSKAIWEGGGDDTIGALPQDDNNYRADRSLSPFNAANAFVFSPLWQLPVGKGRHYLNQGGILNGFLGGWEATAIITLQSGFPFTVHSANDYSNSLSSSPRPDRICNGSGQRTISNWFNSGCFSTTALAAALANGTPRFGNSGEGILTGPGLRSWDFGLIKRNSIRERLKVEFRAEFFNAFNMVHFTPPNAAIGSGTVGQISGAGDPRLVQFGLKMTF